MAIDFNFVSNHEPECKLPWYTSRRNLIHWGAHMDFYYVQKKKFSKVSDWQIDGFGEWTLGHLLQEHFIKGWNHIIKKKEFHDVLHVLFDYDECPEWEALLQAFLLWNHAVGDYTYPFLLANILLLPETIHQLYTEYQKGKTYVNVREVDFHAHLGTQKQELLQLLRK